MNRSLKMLSLMAAFGSAALGAQAVEVAYDAPTYDRWNYPFNLNAGSRNLAPTFGAVGNEAPDAETESFDDADAQFYFSFDTSSDFAAGLGASNYTINQITVTATTATGGFAYDPTYDAFGTYSGASADADAGVPIHLFGAGFRNFFTASTYGESGAFAFGDPTAEGVRSAYAADVSGGSLLDVSNFVDDAADVTPLAIGQVDGLNAGETIGDLTTFTFDVDLSDPDVVAYFQAALNDGVVPFSIVSLHSASLGGGEPTPQFFTNDNLDPNAVPVTLVIDAVAVPEPTSLALISLGGVLLMRRRRKSM